MDQRVMIALMTTMGESILVETMKSAVYFLSRSDNRPTHYRDRPLFEEAKQCYFFMQGTGLDQLISYYNLDYDPEAIRVQFNYYVRHSA